MIFTASCVIIRVSNSNAIENNLNPEFKEEFKSGKIGTSAAYELSGMSEEKQAAAFEEYKEKGGVKVDEIKEQKRKIEQGPPIENNSPVTIKGEIPKPPAESEPPAPKEYEPPIIEEYPETPSDFSEGEQSEDSEENAPSDFAEMTEEQKTAAAIEFLQSKSNAVIINEKMTTKTLSLFQKLYTSLYTQRIRIQFLDCLKK